MCVSYIEREKKKVDLIKPHIQYYLLNYSFTATPNFDSSHDKVTKKTVDVEQNAGLVVVVVVVVVVVLITSITNISHSLLSCRL